MSIEDLAAQQRRETTERAKRHAKRQDDAVFLGTGGTALIRGETAQVSTSSNGPLRAGQAAAFLGSGVIDVPSRAGAPQALFPVTAQYGKVKVFFSIQRENSKIVEYWLGGDRKNPSKIIEYDTDIVTVNGAFGQSVGSKPKEWIFTIRTYSKGAIDSPHKIETFFGDSSKNWSINNGKARYLNWYGFDFWATEDISAGTIEDTVYSKIRTPSPSELIVYETYTSNDVANPASAYFNSVWSLGFSGNQQTNTTTTYRPPIESVFVSTYRNVLTIENRTRNKSYVQYSIYGEDGVCIEKTISWENNQIRDSNYNATYWRRNSFLVTQTSIISTVDESETATYEKYVASNTKIPSSINLTQNYSFSFYEDTQNPSNNVPGSPTPPVSNSNKVASFFSFNGGYLYTRYRSSYRWFLVVGSVETELIFSGSFNLITSNPKYYCWTVVDGSLAINVAPSLANGSIPSGDSINFTRRKLAGNQLEDAPGFSEKLYPINIGQTNQDKLETISIQCWVDQAL
jgi:hypothetical protein